MDSLRGSSVNIGTIQRRLAWPLRKDDTHKSRSVNNDLPGGRGPPGGGREGGAASGEPGPELGSIVFRGVLSIKIYIYIYMYIYIYIYTHICICAYM